MKDSYNREINYMRISVTGSCNFHCVYCDTGKELCSKPKICEQAGTQLSAQEIVLICRQAVKLGIVNFKITGGEPLLRQDTAEIIREMKNIKGVRSVTLTTNGYYLKEKLPELVAAGLDAVNVSLDTLDAKRFAEITGVDGWKRVVEGVLESRKYLPVKLNVVLLENKNREEWADFIDFGKRNRITVRFIELMPFGGGRLEKSVDNREILTRIRTEQKAELKIDSMDQERKTAGSRDPQNGPARYYTLPDSGLEVGFISAMHHRFCSTCNRIRLTFQGELRGCLCQEEGITLLPVLRDCVLTQEEREKQILEILGQVIAEKPRMHHLEDETQSTAMPDLKQIGG